ncbi:MULTISPECIES: hypothetical protein [Streptomyces]|uniref:Uncharacterized protein n=1 Tax=Streptomyces dengpaensis TaxID=2049881 RepID=A0ABM6T016_9ACTN|nr:MULTISPECIES: hypothetical protein [Streptomyces]AVH60291.1 hypothetical protein C4B68_35930 [Streptomyces dengpaensis]PIB06760.1 hypothetical protein B1C81_23495 [Streptomyces sp. HG99]
MTAGWCSRTVRAAMFAAVCVLLAALGHVMMSGSPVAWWAMAGGVVAMGGVGWSLAGRERGQPLIVSVVVVAQGLLHSAFSVAQSVASGSGLGSMGVGALPWGSTGHDMSSMHMESMHMESMHMSSAHMSPAHMESMHMGSMDSMSADAMDMGHMGHMDSGGTSSFGMLAAHLLAALLCGLWLAYGERAVFRILRAVAGWLAAPLRLPLALPAPPHCPRFRVRRGSSDRAPRHLLLVHAITSRGPPVGTAVV